MPIINRNFYFSLSLSFLSSAHSHTNEHIQQSINELRILLVEFPSDSVCNLMLTDDDIIVQNPLHQRQQHQEKRTIERYIEPSICLKLSVYFAHALALALFLSLVLTEAALFTAGLRLCECCCSL